MAIIAKKRKSGMRYYVALYSRATDGRQKLTYHPGAYRTKREAQAAERHLLEQRRFGVDTTPDRRTLAEAAQEWLDAKKGAVTEGTRRHYATYANRYVLPSLGSLPVTAITPESIEQVYRGLRDQGLSETTVRHASVVLGQIFRRLIRQGRLVRNPALMVENGPSVRSHLPDTPSPEALRALLDRLPDTTMGDAIRLAIHTGMRRGEVCGLQWGDLDLAGGTVAVRRSLGEDRTIHPVKSRSGERIISIPDEMVQMLAALPRGGLWVFTAQGGRPIAPTALSQAFAKLKSGRLHDIRHAHASLMLSYGVDMATVFARLGHANTASTASIYAHAVPGRDRAAAALFRQTLDAPGEKAANSPF